MSSSELTIVKKILSLTSYFYIYQMFTAFPVKFIPPHLPISELSQKLNKVWILFERKEKNFKLKNQKIFCFFGNDGDRLEYIKTEISSENTKHRNFLMLKIS